MKQLYASSRAVVLHAEREEVCALLGPRGVDVTITDPPYTEHVQSNIRSCSTNGKLKVRAWEPGFDHLRNFAHARELIDCTKRWTLCFSALESFAAYESAVGGQWKAGGSYVRSGIWRKQQAAPQLSGDRPANSCEGIAVMHRRAEPGERMHWNGRGKHAYWRTDGEFTEAGFAPRDDLFLEYGRERAEKRHPCQKPIAMVRELVRLFSDPGEWILDPYCGSGAHGIAALLEGRNVILADNDAAWAEHTARAIESFERTLEVA